MLVEIGYHDNYADAVWIEGHVEAIAQQLARALTRYFDLPFIYPSTPVTGTVAVSYGTLNLRDYPSSDGRSWPICRRLGRYGLRRMEGWYVVGFGEQLGYAAAATSTCSWDVLRSVCRTWAYTPEFFYKSTGETGCIFRLNIRFSLTGPL